MKTSQIVLLIVGVLVTAGVPSIIAIDQANQARMATEHAHQAALQAQKAAEAEHEQLQKEQDVIKQRAAEQERAAEARRAEEQARREEEARIAAEQRRQEQERLAAQQRERQQMMARTTEAWEQFAEVMVTVASYSNDDAKTDPLALMKYVVNSLEPISLRQVDTKVATLIGDYRDTSRQMYELVVDFQSREKQLGLDVAQGGKFGCEAVNATREQNSLGWCLVGGLLGSGLTYANGSEALEQLRAEYASQIEILGANLEAYATELEVIPSYLEQTYDIDVTEI